MSQSARSPSVGVETFQIESSQVMFHTDLSKQGLENLHMVAILRQYSKTDRRFIEPQ